MIQRCMKYNVRIYYDTFIDIEVEAKDEETARELAEMQVDVMDYKDFTEAIRDNFVNKDESDVFDI